MLLAKLMPAFIHFCCQDRVCRFGCIGNGEMVLNDAGKIAETCWLEIPQHFPNAVLHEYVVMPRYYLCSL